jgi:hypothetical protein
MDKLSVAHKRLKVARGEIERDLEEYIRAQDEWESRLQERMRILINIEVTNEDLIEVNAGVKIVVSKHSILTKIQGSKFEGIFSGRWDKTFLRDNQRRFFLDINPTCFQAILNYLNDDNLI